MFRQLKRLVDRVANGDLIVRQNFASGNREGRARIFRGGLYELIQILVRLVRLLRGDVPFNVGFTTVGKDDRDRDVRALKRLRRGTDNIRFAVASERRKRIRIDGRVAEFDLRGLFREEDRSRRGGRKFSPRVLCVCAVLDEVAARSVGERSENRGVHDRADAVAVDRNASVDELFNRFFKDAFVKRRTGAHTATDKDERTIRALVVIEGVGRDREGLL